MLELTIDSNIIQEKRLDVNIRSNSIGIITKGAVR